MTISDLISQLENVTFGDEIVKKLFRNYGNFVHSVCLLHGSSCLALPYIILAITQGNTDTVVIVGLLLAAIFSHSPTTEEKRDWVGNLKMMDDDFCIISGETETEI